ncbi:50S ribosomal protein L18 [Patescibacteria group bacterium]|nr:50S ribosomal protein L18 [Patescibacteria group bacterium]MBU1721589.1 50S ribosomal protein L18 [Patescibacteria group bacterium]MBU1901815.1 50S ribosomal protein L18 [Patescibacteria group bacterium]
MAKKLTKSQQRKRRHARVRAKISGTAARPRLHVQRTLTSIYAQLIDDINGKTLVAVHSKKVGTVDAGERKGKIAVAYAVGSALAAVAKDAGITTVVFDRGGNIFTGRVQAVADGARDGGLIF